MPTIWYWNWTFLGPWKRLAAISVRGDDDELFLSYGFNKEKSKQLFSLYKVCLPNIFQSTCFKKHKDFLKSDDKGDSSTLFCYLPSTTDRKESVNQYNGNVQLHPIDCAYEKFLNFLVRKVFFILSTLSQLIQKSVKSLEKLSLISWNILLTFWTQI